MLEWILERVVQYGLEAFVGFLKDEIAQSQRDASNRQQGAETESHAQAEAGKKVDDAVQAVADKPPTEDDVFGRLGEGTA